MANDTDLPQSEIEGPESGFDETDGHGTNASPPRFGRLALCVAAAGALAFGVLGTVAYSVWFNHDQQAYAEAIANARQAFGVPAASGSAAASMAAKSAASTGPAVSVSAATARTAATTVAMAPVPVPTRTVTAVTVAPAPPVAMATTGAPATTTPVSAPTINPSSIATPSTAQTALESDGEEGSKQAVWSGAVAPAPASSAPTTLADAPPAAPATPAPSLRSTRRATSSADPAAQQSAAARAGKDARLAQQERRAAAANAKHKNSLFARVSEFFRRVSYRQHGSGRQQQDPYTHP
jgi:hypothetical protein